jgi:hypothetical protein
MLRKYPGIRVEGLMKTTKTVRPASGTKFELGTSGIRSRDVNHSTMKFGLTLKVRSKELWLDTLTERDRPGNRVTHIAG